MIPTTKAVQLKEKLHQTRMLKKRKSNRINENKSELLKKIKVHQILFQISSIFIKYLLIFNIIFNNSD